MKALVLSLLTLLTINLPDGKAGAQNVWYVDINATGSNDTGRDWANAWTDFDSVNYFGTGRGINWSIIQPGDTIYISGGTTETDTTFYTIDLIYGWTALWQQHNVRYTFASGDPVIITKAWHPGHNGVVCFATADEEQHRVAWFGIGLSNVKFTGFTFWNRQTVVPGGQIASFGATSLDYPDADSMIVVENCHFVSEGAGAGVGLKSTKSIIRNCIIEHRADNDYDGDTDPLGLVGGKGGNVIDNNIIILRNGSMTTTSHKDMIQFGDFYNDPTASARLPFIISNNLIIDTREEGVGLNAVIYSASHWANLTYYFYNNIIVNKKTYESQTPFFVYRYGIPEFEAWRQSIHILNNTVITKGNGETTIFTHTRLDTIEIKNNLVVIDTTYDIFFNMDDLNDYPYSNKEIDYNFYAARGGITSTFGLDNSVIKSFTGWRSTFGYDVHSDTTDSRNVIFANKYGLEKEDYYTETGNGQGVNLWDEYPFLRYDALGNPRPETGGWDIGALQYSGGQSNNVNVKGKVFLQGPFDENTGSMSITLNQSGFLPNSQPYNTTPWNYSGNESFSSGPNSTMVDWVLVELRSASNPAQLVARRAALLKNNGLLLEPNGMEGVYFNNVDPGSYYIAVYHRNHLAIMSAAPVQLSSNSVLYDFTTAMNKAYGQNPMVDLGAGKYGMFASDANGDGVIENLDSDIYLEQRGSMGYKGGDFNMDSGVSVYDVNQFWNINNGAVTQVP